MLLEEKLRGLIVPHELEFVLGTIERDYVHFLVMGTKRLPAFRMRFSIADGSPAPGLDIMIEGANSVDAGPIGVPFRAVSVPSGVVERAMDSGNSLLRDLAVGKNSTGYKIGLGLASYATHACSMHANTYAGESVVEDPLFPHRRSGLGEFNGQLNALGHIANGVLVTITYSDDCPYPCWICEGEEPRSAAPPPVVNAHPAFCTIIEHRTNMVQRPVAVFPSKLHGRGLFATEGISGGKAFAKYAGELVLATEVDESKMQYLVAVKSYSSAEMDAFIDGRKIALLPYALHCDVETD